MAVGQQQVEVTVVVVVEKLQSPTAHQLRGFADTGWERCIAESLLLVIVVKGKHFVVNVGLEEVDPAILIVVSRVDTHSRTRFAESAHADSREHSNLLEFPTPAIGKQEVGNGVVCHEEVHAAVIVDVGSNHSPSFGE